MLLVAVIACHSYAATSYIQTPFEKSNNKTLPDSKQVDAFLKQLSDDSNKVSELRIGTSAGGREINVLLISKDSKFLTSGKSDSSKATVMLIGSQHGNEPAGAEALQKLAAELAFDNESTLLDNLNLVVIPLANPDGRDLHSRYNANRENPNLDYSALASPETLIYVKALRKFKPKFIFDIHESGIEKSVLTGKQGYFTDVHAQYEVGNNPNIAPELLAYSEEFFLPQLIDATSRAGLPAKRYLGEITHLDQPVKRGGIGITNFRNYAAMRGILSVLVENRLDSKNGDYPTPRNIERRVKNQLISTQTFLNLVSANHDKIIQLTEQSQYKSQQKPRNIYLDVSFEPNSEKIVKKVPLTKKETGQAVEMSFTNFDKISGEEQVVLPKAYVVAKHQESFRGWLDKHGIAYQVIEEPQEQEVGVLSVENLNISPKGRLGIRRFVDLDLNEVNKQVLLKKGDLVVPMTQPLGTLAGLMLDPRSSSSIFQEPAWQGYLKDSPLPIYTIR